MLELDGGVQSGRVPATDWSWLPVIELDETELADANTLSRTLGQGEARCIALAASRGWLVLTDDREARTTAQSLGVAVSGTLGTLANLVRGKAITLAEADTLLLQMMRHGYHSPVQTLSELLDGS